MHRQKLATMDGVMRNDEDRDVGTLSAVDERDVVAISVFVSAFSRISTRRLRGHTTIGLVASGGNVQTTMSNDGRNEKRTTMRNDVADGLGKPNRNLVRLSPSSWRTLRLACAQMLSSITLTTMFFVC